MATLSLHVRFSPCLVLSLDGEVDLQTAPGVGAVLDAALRSDTRRGPIALDMGHVRFIDSQGLRVLARATRLAEEHGTSLVLCNPSPHVRLLWSAAGGTGVPTPPLALDGCLSN